MKYMMLVCTDTEPETDELSGSPTSSAGWRRTTPPAAG